MKTALPFTGRWAALAICVLAGAVDLQASEPKPARSKPAATRSLDDELLEGLGDPEEDEALGAKSVKSRSQKDSAAKSKGPEAKPRARPAAANDVDDELLKGLGDGEDVDLGGKPGDLGGKPGRTASGGAADNPLFDLGRRMREAEQRIAAARSDEETQQLQDRIAKDLAKLIKELQRRKKSSSSSPSTKDQQTAEREKVEQPGSAEAGGQEEASDAPAQDSTSLTKNRKAQTPGAAQMEEALKDIWGQLPAHLRQQMEQYATEELLPKYELQIEEYFRALAKGQRRP